MAQIEKVKSENIERHERGWGYELWIENSELYCGKILHLYEGKRSSLHYHMKKTETMYLQRGKISLKTIDPETGRQRFVCLDPGDKILLEPGRIHQIIALENSDLFEFSTYHEDSDSWRVEKGD